MLNCQFRLDSYLFVFEYLHMKRTIHIKDTGLTLSGKQRKQVKRCKLSNSNNRKSDTMVQAQAMQGTFMELVRKFNRAEAQRDARRAKRSR